MNPNPSPYPAARNDDSSPHAVKKVASVSVWAYQPDWEQCERRLAMSAMPWTPWDIGLQPAACSAFDHNPQANDLKAVHHPPSPLDASMGPAIEQHLSEAHSQTGWNQVQSQFGLTGKGQTVAVIDSGIAFDHVALGKGYGPGYKVVGGWDFAENDARPYDDAPAGFHGTHVAGIVGANDGVHFGVAPNVDLVSLRVFTDTGKSETAWTENALRWVHENRNSFANPITTVNLSLGSAWNSSTVPSWGVLEDELAQLQRDGIVVVASAGNSFQQHKTPGLAYPAASPFVIPVSSIDANGQLSDFSQRDSRSIAAPGRSIESAVPDYFYGKDGVSNDWATSSGTSMAAPYVAGASVLVREAMELVGIQNITPQSIYDHLKSTANSVWDSVTKQNYQTLDLDRAIESLLPQDTAGDTLATGQATTLQTSWRTDGWINSLSDRDVYRIAPTENGNVSVQLGSETIDDAVFKVLRGGQETAVHASNGRLSFSVLAGESIGLSIADPDAIGSYRLDWSFAASSTGGGGSGGGSSGNGSGGNGSGGGSDGSGANIPTNLVDLGSIDLLRQSLDGLSRYKVTAEHTGTLSVVVDAGTQTSGSLQVLRPSMANGTLTDSTVEGNQWRIDLSVTQGQSIEFALPGTASRSVQVVNLLQQQGSALTIHGTDASDSVKIDLSNGLVADVAGIAYKLDSNAIKSIELDGLQNNDSLAIVGSNQAEKVELRPGLSTLENAQVSLRASNFENVQFVGGGGPDRAYLYDAATDDRLNIWPNKAELTGVGYAFSVDQVERIFVHAVQGGDDQAFVFDSVGNDSLSVRPQFTSLGSTGYFNYIAGFERVFAYSSAGGIDSAMLYDSVGNDLFSTSGEVSSIVGPGFSTFARGFENVEAFSTAGGTDRATVFAPAGGKLTSAPDYVGMQDATRSSVARNFERIEAYASGQLVPTQFISQSIAELSNTSSNPEPLGEATAAPMQSTIWQSHPYQTNVPPTSFAVPSPDTHDGLASSNAIEERLNWLTDLVDREIRSNPMVGRAKYASSDNSSIDEFTSSLDLSWADSAKERSTLDQIFSEHA